jgi:hypothetical protein
MRRAAMLVLVALLGVAVLWGQGTNSSQTAAPSAQTPSTQNSGTAPAAPNATNPQSPSTPAAQSGSAIGEASQTTGAQSAPATSQGESPATPAPATSQVPATTQSAPAATGTVPTDQNSAQPSTYPQQVAPAPTGADQVPVNTEMHATLDTPLSSKTSKPGDRFTATIQNPVRGSNGSVIIPAGSRVEGEVSEAEEGKTLAALRGKGKLSVRFRDIALPRGQTVPLTATLVSVNNTNGKSTKKADEEGQIQSGTQGKDVAKDVGIGAGIGTVAGLIFGGPLKGLAIGALAGGGYVLATKGKDVELPAQTGMVIRLDQPISGAGLSGPQGSGQR